MRTLGLVLAGLLAAGGTSRLADAQALQPDGGGIRAGTLPVAWDTGGPKCMEMPEWQIHEYNSDLFILRQSGCTDFEKPFVFLFFGAERALLLDTGSHHGNIAATLRITLHRWLLRNSKSSIPLLIVHTHSHLDHVAGDAELQAMNDPSIPVTLVPATAAADAKFYGIAHWPEDTGQVDLGGRIIDALAIPGHDEAGVALYDRQTAILFTGDSVYPGRLYIHDLAAFQASNERMIRFTDGKLLAHVIGNHIEQTRTPYLDYPEGTIYQPDEHALELPRGVLLEIEAGLLAMHGKMQHVLSYRDFSLWPAGPAFRDTDASRAAFEKTQQQQRARMWDQSQP